jgi:peptidoglycan hydrolase-like protein with peptidoglycan-binding domain
MASINGFSVLNFGDPALRKFKIPGTEAKLSLRREVAALMVGLAADFHKNVENLNPKSCWGHDHRKIAGTNSWSFHAPGIAIDLNASRHPRGQRGTFTAGQVTSIRRLLKDYSYHGVRLFRWGGDFHTKVDEMHFEIIVPRGTALKAVASIGHGRGVPNAQPTHKPGSRQLELRDPRMEGDDVEYVQRWIGDREAGAPDGFFGPDTRDGVRWYQGMRGIEVTGVCDRKTWRNIGIEPTF